MTGEKKTYRCAIYTRKSSEEGLEQDFNSLAAQREACEAYIRSQAHEGWKQLPDQFDDGGFSGGNMDRPALKQLIDLVSDGRVDIIVVYKIDRLTRSLTDFAKLAEVLEKQGVSFVSVTQQFNTTNSMGRLMLNVLLSFAQFEREITGERIRDKIAASKKKGMWMGGVPPMGYDVANRQLVVNEIDAATVRRVFALYLEEGTVSALLGRLERDDIRTAPRYSAKGNHYGNRPFTRGHLHKLLTNPIYIGRVPHKSVSHRGQHPGIIDKDTWDAVQAQLANNTQGARVRGKRGPTLTHLLEGLLFTEAAASFGFSTTKKGTRRYRYYVEGANSDDAARETHQRRRLPAAEIEAAVVAGLRSILADHRGLIAHLDLDAADVPVVLQSASRLMEALGGRLDVRLFELIRGMLRRVVVGSQHLRLVLSTAATGAALGIPPRSALWPTNDGGEAEISVTVPLSATRRGRQTKLVLPGHSGPGRIDRSLVTAIVRAWDWADRLISGEVETMAEICADEGLSDTYVGQVLPLAFLSPEIVEVVLAGTQPAGLTANRLVWRDGLPPAWSVQCSSIRRGGCALDR